GRLGGSPGRMGVVRPAGHRPHRGPGRRHRRRPRHLDQGLDRPGDRLTMRLWDRARRSPDGAWRLAWVVAGIIPVAFLALFFFWPAGTLVARGFWSEGKWTLE